jgi:uncharacterized protein
MVSRNDIEKFASEIAEQFHPEKIILFGSYAYGTPTPDSDVDIVSAYGETRTLKIVKN